MFLSSIRGYFTKPRRTTSKRRGRNPQNRPVRARLTVEALEDRVLMSSPGANPPLFLSAALVKNVDIVSPAQIGEMVDVPHLLFGNTLFFTVNEKGYSELWKSDGTAAGTVPVRNPRSFGYGSLNPQNLTAVGNTLFFSGFDGIGQELWKSDGTAAGTVLVKEINPPAGSDPIDLISVDNQLFFVADDGQHGSQVWTSDGTGKGTVMVTDIVGANGVQQIQDLVSVNDVLYFTVDRLDGKGPQLWEHLLLFGNIDLGYSNVSNLTAVGKSLYFDGIDQMQGGTALYVINAKGQRIELNVFPAAAPDQLTDVNGKLFFTADDFMEGVDTDSGIQLWMSNGTPQGTVLVDVIDPQATQLISSYDFLTSFKGLLYFGVNDGINGQQLWRSDGTHQGTYLVQVINPTGDANPAYLTVVGTGDSARLFFTADDGTHGVELWSTDGAPGAAALVRDIVPGPNGSNPKLLTAANSPIAAISLAAINSPLGDSFLYFKVNDDIHGDQLWKTGEFPLVSLAPVADQANNEGDQISLQVQATGGTLTYSATNLPAGLTIDPATGLISGTLSPQASEHSPYAVTVTADDGGFLASAKFSWKVIDTTTPVVQNPGPQTNNEGNIIQLNIVATDADNDPLTYSATNLPPGLSIDPNTGVISGNLGNQAAGTYAVTVSATDGQNTGVAAFSWKVVDITPPVVTNPGTQNSNEGNGIGLFITATDADNDPLTFSAVNLPPGLTIDSVTGKISGTVGNQAAGTYQVTVYASDGTFQSSAQFTWNVFDITTPVVANPGDQNTVNGASVNLAISATDADNDPLTYTATNLPPGLSIDPNTGLIAGTVSLVAGRNPTFDVTIFVSDGFNTGSVSFVWTVLAG